MKVSLILATVNRVNELEIFLKSLSNQTYQKFELILVDQNMDARLNEIVNKYRSTCKIKHIQAERGLSKARNVGFHHITGDIVAFPDDDCEYADDTLEKVVTLLKDQKKDGVTGISISGSFEKNNHLMVLNSLCLLNIYNVWVKSISYTIFLKRDVCEYTGLFDETLGVGSNTPYGSGEETDYLVRAIKGDYKIYHCKLLEIRHPEVDFYLPNIEKKAISYSRGRRYVLDKHQYNYIFILLNIYYPLLKLIFNFYNSKKMKFFWNQFLGRLK